MNFGVATPPPIGFSISQAPLDLTVSRPPTIGAFVEGSQGPAFSGFGWSYVQDGQFTLASPLSIGAGQATQLTINGAGSSTDASFLRVPFAGWSFWHDGKFWPYSIGDAYDLRLDFSAQSLTINNAVRMTLDIGSASGPTFDDYKEFGVAAGVQRNFRFDINVYDKATFDADGATFTVAPVAPMTIWNIGLYIQPKSVGTPR